MGNWIRKQNCECDKSSQGEQIHSFQGRFVFDICQMVKIKHVSIRNQYLILPAAIGKGAFGEVFKAHNKFTKSIRSIKKVGYRAQNDMLEEYEILREFDHPNILKLYEVYLEGPTYFLVTDYYEGGCLRDKIKQLQKVNQLCAARYMQQILMALAYIHNKGFIHCDLKPENILLDKSHKLIKLIDFGVSRRVKDKKCKQKGVGTLEYIAPQVVNGVILPKSDIWSCGVTLIYMLTGRIPSYNQLQSGTYEFDIDVSSLLSKSVKNLIYQMINIDPSKRPTARQALKHQWFSWQRSQRTIDTDSIQRCLSNMKKYIRLNHVQSLFVSMIANFIINQEDKLKPTQVFIQCDKDNDGVISIGQLRNVISQICPKKYKSISIDKIFTELDKNQSHEIDLRQFLACSVDLNVILQDKHIQQVFIEIDSDKDSKVSIEEFVNYVNFIVPESGIKQQFFSKLDVNNDGYIELQQFILSLKSIGQM